MNLRIRAALLAAVVAALPAIAQQQVTVTAVPPPAVQGIGVAITGTPGLATACYWVVVNYVGGAVIAPRPVCKSNLPSPLTMSNFATITWQAAQGAVTYDVLKTTTQAGPVPGASTKLASGLTGTSTTDTGGSLTGYTQNAFPYANARTSLTLNNRDYALPTIIFTGGFPLSVATSGAGSTFNISQLNDANGNPWLIPLPATNAVNAIVIGNAATGSAPTIKPGATGSDTNIDLTVTGKGTGSLKLGNATTPLTIDSTGAGLNVLYSVSANPSISQVNSGFTLVAAVTGRTLKVERVELQALGGAVGACTDIRISDSIGPVDVLTVTQATLTQNTVINEASGSGVTVGTFAPTALTADAGLQIRKTGSSCTTATTIRAIVFYTINS